MRAVAAIFQALQIGVDEEGSIVDASVVRARQDAAGQYGGTHFSR